MRLLQSVKSFYKEYSQKLPGKQAVLSPVAAKTSLISSFLSYPFMSEKISRGVAKRTVHALTAKLPACTFNPYNRLCQKQATASMQKLEPLLASNPYLSHTLLLLAAANEPHTGKKLHTGFASLYHLMRSLLQSLAIQAPDLPICSSILERNCKEERTQITQNVIFPILQKTNGKLLKHFAINACSLANLAALLRK